MFFISLVGVAALRGRRRRALAAGNDAGKAVAISTIIPVSVIRKYQPDALSLIQTFQIFSFKSQDSPSFYEGLVIADM